ncbi:MAG: hypothetical protein HOW73_19170 [Polyangiaceae bacterium]|nr:hypothetical protein [Polyangiaceae bacterium]
MPVHHVIGGGTVFHVRPHLALSAPAYGGLARQIHAHLSAAGERAELHLTKMADPASALETNEDVAALLDRIVADPTAKIVFLTAALVDFAGSVDATAGKHAARLRSDEGARSMHLVPTPKLIGRVRRERKDLFLVACKATAGATADEQYLAALALLKSASANLVLANDVHTRRSMVVTPEQARYDEGEDRAVVVRGLVDMAVTRSRGRFTRSTIRPGEPVPWSSPLVPRSLRAVVDHCIARGAYKPFMNATVGHFAARLADGRILTSRRKTNFNRLREVGLVLVESTGDDSVIAYGSRPSVGGQSQRIIFADHPDVDCIVHFHCPLRPGAELSIRSQREHECGSHGCGRNTSQGLVRRGGLKAVMLDKHGPNIVFPQSIDPREVIAFIEATFDLEGRTDGVDPAAAERFNQMAGRA